MHREEGARWEEASDGRGEEGPGPGGYGSGVTVGGIGFRFKDGIRVKSTRL